MVRGWAVAPNDIVSGCKVRIGSRGRRDEVPLKSAQDPAAISPFVVPGKFQFSSVVEGVSEV